MGLALKTVVTQKQDGSEYYIEYETTTGVYQGATGIAFTATFATDLLTTVGSHGLKTGDVITVSNSGGALPGPLIENKQYHVTKIADTTFKLSLTEDLTPIIDLTGDGTGSHTFITGLNLGGFNTPNPERNDIAIYWIGHVIKSAGDVDISIDTYDPIAASFVTVLTPGMDGVLEYWLFPLTIYNALNEPYAEGSIVYDNTTAPASPVVRKMESAAWVDRTDAELITDFLEVTGAYMSRLLIVVESKIYLDDLRQEKHRLLRDLKYNNGSESKYLKKRIDVDFIDSELNEACDDFRAGSWEEAQQKIETVLNEKIGC